MIKNLFHSTSLVTLAIAAGLSSTSIQNFKTPKTGQIHQHK